MSKLDTVVTENFARYAGNVILDRAICDVRDMLKPSARMLTYSQLHITKNIPTKPFIKSARVVGDCLGHYYTHGDSSCYSTYMRMAKPFAMRYPLEDCQGNCGTITETGDEAASRYTELRLSKLGYQLFSDIDKDTITDWYDNFDETEVYPKVLCSKGFYNIVNGSTGIGVSLSASIPQFNLNDINNALITLIDNPDTEIDIYPDFATGGILLNAGEVKESLRVGKGAACKLRSIIEYDKINNCLIVKELPYGVYTSTISSQIKKIVEDNPNYGVDHINDGSGKTVDYIIYLSKGANPNNVLKKLYKDTSLQSYFTINMTVLVDNGSRPQVMGLKDMLLEHIEHEKVVYRRGFEFDLRKIEKRIHIIDGLLICLSHIEEVVQTIKNSNSTAIARAALIEKFVLDEEQADAVLDMKLSRLAHLEVKKLEDEKLKLEEEAGRIKTILTNEEVFNNCLKAGWTDIAKRYGDSRRTQILNIEKENDEPVDEKQLIFSLTNENAVYTSETSSLYAQKRNGVGNKIKLNKGEYLETTFVAKNTDNLLLFSNIGNFYTAKADIFNLNEKNYLTNSISLKDNENIITACAKADKKYIIFITRKGYIKKSKLEEYNLKRGNSGIAIKLDEDDEIASVVFANEEKLGIASYQGHFIMIETNSINSIGRNTKGVIGMKLDKLDYVVSANIIPNEIKEIITVSSDGYIKKSDISDFTINNRGAKGKKVQNTKELCDFLPISDEEDIIIITSNTQLRIKTSEVPSQGLNTQGVKAAKLSENSKILKIMPV